MNTAALRFADRVLAVLPLWCRPYTHLTALVRRRSRGVVAGGPYAGMRYVDEAVGSVLAPKILGTYERELNVAISDLGRPRDGCIVVIGAGEGYHAVGLAYSNPALRVVSFEANSAGRKLIGELARRNGAADQVEVHGRCSPQILQRELERTGASGIICDVEGYEQELLDPSAAPALLSVRILVEVHEFSVQGITGVLKQRFQATHRIEQIWARNREAREFPYRSVLTRLLPEICLTRVMNESRPPGMSWLWMVPAGDAR